MAAFSTGGLPVVPSSLASEKLVFKQTLPEPVLRARC
jgi:hypothetical protein